MKFFTRWIVVPFMSVVIATTLLVAFAAWAIQLVLLGVVKGAMFVMVEAASYCK